MIVDVGKLSVVLHDRGLMLAWDRVIKWEWIWRKRRPSKLDIACAEHRASELGLPGALPLDEVCCCFDDV